MTAHRSLQFPVPFPPSKVKISRATPDLLVLTDLGAPLRITGVIAFIISGAFVVGAIRSPAPVVIPWVAALVLGAGSIAMILLPQRVTAVFDRSSRTLRISRRSIRGSTLDEVDFRRISSVIAEGSRSSVTAPATWRVCIVLQDGTRVPLTSYYDSSTTHMQAAAAANEFLGLPPVTPESPVAQGDAAAPRIVTKRPPSIFVLSVITIFAIVFAGFGVRLLLVEWHRLTVSLPTRAYVLSTDVQTVRSSGRNSSISYRPVVLYRFRVDGRDYTAQSVTPLNESRGGHWAFDLVSRYRAGDSVTAWYDPARPQTAFLRHEWSLMPLVFIAFPLLFIGVALFAFKKSRTTGGTTATAQHG